MALLDIEVLGARILREEAAPVEAVDDDVRRLARDMFDTMYHAEGIGLAGPQVGVSRRILVVDVKNDDESRHVHALVNPVVVEVSREQDKASEGCLSIPGLEENVTRPVRVTVEALSLDGDPVRIEADGLLARALQHEVDHLDGVLFIDRLSPLKRGILLRKWRRNQRTSERG
ncbi:MAG: peptide deformylase [Gemmatimonadetes bacterium]|nr:peptide deformylase [Gemmatimonadota bacterium]MYE15182.1 peptide deformylase [Gemmatimonadota bacterium]MYG22415.1 peptide deformylase [Gemmatimonadota bacterium]MYJ39844.1 peptide deformylase [Gemmatimonadota bacterium]